MRRRFSGSWRALVGGVALAMVAGAAPALADMQEGPGGRRLGRMGPRGGGAPARMLGLRQLDLTEAQRDQIRGIMQEQQKEFAPVRDRLRDARAKVRGAETATEFNESALRSAMSELAEAQADAAVLRAKVREKVWSLLTDEQKAKAQSLRAEREQRMQQRRQRMQERLKQRQGGQAPR
jgi:Spy/CpxP family protein refolding chaperone